MIRYQQADAVEPYGCVVSDFHGTRMVDRLTVEFPSNDVSRLVAGGFDVIVELCVDESCIAQSIAVEPTARRFCGQDVWLFRFPPISVPRTTLAVRFGVQKLDGTVELAEYSRSRA